MPPGMTFFPPFLHELACILKRFLLPFPFASLLSPAVFYLFQSNVFILFTFLFT